MDTTRKALRESSASKLGLFYSVKVDDVEADPTLLTILTLLDIHRSREKWEDAFLYQNSATTGEWRRIDAVNETTGEISLNRAFTVPPVEGDTMGVYLMLTPDEWNASINDMLGKLYNHIRDSISIVDAQTEYDLASWVQYKGMVVDVRYRNSSTGQETAVPRFRLDETGNAVVLHLLDKPWASTTYQLIVEAKRFYPQLTTDLSSDPSPGADDTGVTTCPEPLWQPAVIVSALHRLINKYGDRIKKLYNQDLAIAERDYMTARASVLPQLVAREYNQDEDWGGWPDIDMFYLHSGWAL